MVLPAPLGPRSPTTRRGGHREIQRVHGEDGPEALRQHAQLHDVPRHVNSVAAAPYRRRASLLEDRLHVVDEREAETDQRHDEEGAPEPHHGQ